jgi:hypothetical protein
VEPSAEDDRRQAHQWYDLYDLIVDELEKFGAEGISRSDDFSVDTDNFGTLQHKVYVLNLSMLRSAVVVSLQQVVQRYPSWEIVYAVAVSRMDKSLPAMWLVIRASEILDALQRQYLPPPYQDLSYEGARPLTDAEWKRYGPDD